MLKDLEHHLYKMIREQSHSHSTLKSLIVTYVGLEWPVTTDFGIDANGMQVQYMAMTAL